MTELRDYVNRKVYNTATNKYINISEIAELVSKDIEFFSVRRGKDSTRELIERVAMCSLNNKIKLLSTERLVSLIKELESVTEKGAACV